jgi:putative transposase
MAFHYNITNQIAIHFVTFTVHQWVDVFTRSLYVDILKNAIKYCQKNKGLQDYAWVIMSKSLPFNNYNITLV